MAGWALISIGGFAKRFLVDADRKQQILGDYPDKQGHQLSLMAEAQPCFHAPRRVELTFHPFRGIGHSTRLFAVCPIKNSLIVINSTVERKPLCLC